MEDLKKPASEAEAIDMLHRYNRDLLPQRFGMAGRVWVGFLLVVCGMGLYYYVQQLIHGLSVTGLTDTVSWGIYISNFVFFVAVSLVGSLITAYGIGRRPEWAWAGRLTRFTGHHWSWAATLLIGIGQLTWIAIELVSIPFSFLMPTFGMVGAALVLLPLTPSLRAYLLVPAPAIASGSARVMARSRP